MRGQVWIASFVVFVGSACSMIIELVAGRILAPYVGVSLYTWTSIIGVVLAGVSLGNYLGGRVADKWSSRTTLGLLFFLSGLSSLSMLPLAQLVTGAALPTSVSLIARILIFSAAIFFVPSLVLGMISPLVVKLTLRDLARAGNVVGQIYAFSAMGSIFGTFLTGFVLISWLGTRAIVWLVALTLLIMGVVFGEFWRLRWRLGITLGVFLIFGGTFYFKHAEYQAPCLKESNYFCIQVQDARPVTIPDEERVKALILDHLLHSYVALDNPRLLGYAYERVYAEVTEYVVGKRQPPSALFIGGGGYTFPRYVEAVYPGSTVDVVEIDPEVTRVVYDHLNLKPETTIRTHNEDARMFFSREPAQKYDLVFGDAFNDLSVPYHLTTREFNDRVRAWMKDDGLYLLNIIDSFQKGEFLRAMARTLRLTFPYVYILSPGGSFGDGAMTYILMASPRPFDMDEFESVVSQHGQKRMASTPLPQERFESFLKAGRPIILTDDYVPVDNLVAPLFVERGF